MQIYTQEQIIAEIEQFERSCAACKRFGVLTPAYIARAEQIVTSMRRKASYWPKATELSTEEKID